SVWGCPVCSARVARVRAGEVREVIRACRAEGGEAYLLSLTTPHDQGDALQPLMKANADAWRYVCSGRAWMALKREVGCIGFVRGADDPTVGPNGWHPHVHVVLLCKRPLTESEQDRVKRHVYARWAKRVQKHGYRRPSWDRGVVLTVSREDEYITKLG